MYFNILIVGHFNIEILICGLAMGCSRLYLEYKIDQYTFACDLNSVCIVYLTFDCLYVFEMEFILFNFYCFRESLMNR